VRPALSGVERAARAGSPRVAGGGGGGGGGAAGGPPRPSSPPKKRKAAAGLDKEFNLKDDKVKRNTGGWAAGGGRGEQHTCVRLASLRLG
jgi:hypothetical protein